MQDDLRSQLNQQKITNKQEVGNIGSRYLVRDSDISNPENGNFKTTTSELNIFGNSETGSENVGKPDLSEDRKVHTTRLNCNLKQTWEGAQMSKNHPVDFFENFASFSGKNSKVVNNHKRMNSTEIVNGDVQAK